MSYNGIDDIVQSNALEQKYRADFFKLSGGAAMVAGNAYDLSIPSGNPVGHLYPGTALNAVAPNETTGFGIPHGGDVSPDQKQALVASLMAVGSNAAPGIAILVDIALYYPGVNLLVTTLQTMVNGVGLSRYTNGLGLKAYIVTTALTGTPAGTPRINALNYRDQVDVDAALSVGTLDFTTGAAGIPPVSKIVHAGPQANLCGPFLPLNAGDTGIKRINSFQLTTPYTGATTLTAAIVLAKPLLSMPLVAVGSPAERSFLSQLPTIPDGACLAWLYFPGAAVAANSAFMGHLDLGWS
jgi:hypothetical protein